MLFCHVRANLLLIQVRLLRGRLSISPEKAIHFMRTDAAAILILTYSIQTYIMAQRNWLIIGYGDPVIKKQLQSQSTLCQNNASCYTSAFAVNG
jgi:hypothetical protein